VAARIVSTVQRWIDEPNSAKLGRGVGPNSTADLIRSVDAVSSDATGGKLGRRRTIFAATSRRLRQRASCAARNVLSDGAAPDSKRWISEEIISPQSQLSDAAAPISEGVPPPEMQPDRPADSNYPLSTRQSIEAQSDRRIVSDITPDNDWMPGARYASKAHPPRRPGGPIQIGDRFFTPSYEQGIRLTMAEARAQDAIARVREFDPSWRPRQSVYESIEGLIRAHEADAQQA
jgi:hypothetical protein